MVVQYKWQEMERIATGCRDDYIQPSQDGIRMWKSGIDIDDDATGGDPILQMQEGVPVLFYNAPQRAFERRVLKVDDRLNFLYVLVDNVSVKGSMKELKQHDPISAKIDSIGRVMGGEEALRTCYAHDVQDSHLTLESAHVIVLGDPPEQLPPLDSTLIFMAAPQQRLKKCLESVMCMAPDPNTVMEDAAKLVQSHARNAALRQARKGASRGIVEFFVLQDVSAIFDVSVSEFVFELGFNDGTKHPVKISATMDPLACDEEAAKVAAALEALEAITVNPTDAARLAFTMKECLSLRMWATTVAPSVFKQQLYGLLQNSDPNSVVPMDENFRAVQTELTQALQKFEETANTGADLSTYFSGASTRAFLRSLLQTLELETTFARLHGNLGQTAGGAPQVPAVTLSGAPTDHSAAGTISVSPDAAATGTPSGGPSAPFSGFAGPTGTQFPSALAQGTAPNQVALADGGQATSGSAASRLGMPNEDPNAPRPSEGGARGEQPAGMPAGIQIVGPNDQKPPGNCPCSGARKDGRPGDGPCTGAGCVVQ